MPVTKEIVQKYRKLHERKFGQSITMQEAEQNIINLMELIRLVPEKRSSCYGE